MRPYILATTSVLFLGSCSFLYLNWLGWLPALITGALLAVAIKDSTQKRHSIRKNFPVIGHFRYFLESIRPEIQQYFVESDTNGGPIARIYRSLVYQMAKGELDTVPFGSELDQNHKDYKWVNHSCFPLEPKKEEFRVKIGNFQCRKPYSASLLNISAMSYGSLSHAAISALGKGAAIGSFYHNTGEGGLSPFHLESGADVVWQLGTAYFSARDQNGYFDPESFKQLSAHPNVKMIEIKISQGAKPGHGGILPAAKVTEEIAKIRKVEVGKTVVSPPAHTAFTNPHELCNFIQVLRELSEGKPIGFKMCLGRREEFIKICEAIRDSKIYPDFITIDGGEGGTGAAPFDFINFVGSPLNEALYFADQTLKQTGIREHVKLIASGKVFTAFNIFEKLALGADLCNTARGMMLALGCIQAYRCNTNKCPTGIATSDPSLVKGLDVSDKSMRVYMYHKKVMESLNDLLAAAGLSDPEQVELSHISCRSEGRILTLDELFKRTAELTHHEIKNQERMPQGDMIVPEKPRHF